MKKVGLILLSVLLLTGMVLPVMADDDEDVYYLTMCSGSNLSEEQKNECKEYASRRNSELAQQLSDIKVKRQEIEKDLAKIGQEIRGYDAQIAQLTAQISELEAQISEKEALIAQLEIQIQQKEDEIAALREKVEQRLVRSQQTMHTNQFLDFLMGAEDFASLLRRIQGVNDIMNYDKKSLEELKALMDALEADKTQLAEEKAGLETSKTEVEAKKAEVTQLRVVAKIAQEAAEKQAADLEALGNQITANLSAFKSLLSSIDFSGIDSSTGFTKPNGGYLKNGTWYYSSGGVHLGMDIMAGIGTPIAAAGNGVILNSADGCANNGHLGNTCGGSGGSRGGGNQVYLLTNINGTTYAVKYLHMSPGSPIATGSVVSAGDQIGTVGQSGNASAPHTHIEVFKLGTMSIESYANSWNGDLAFGAGWGSGALSNTCDKRGAPCRVKPETAFGY